MARRQPARTFINRKRRWRYLRVKLNDADGKCDPPDKPNKAIRVHNTLSGKREMYVNIHEFRHAEQWDMYDEAYVQEVSNDLTEYMWGLGYRRLDNKTLKLLRELLGDNKETTDAI